MKKLILRVVVISMGCFAGVSNADYAYSPDPKLIQAGISIGIGDGGVVIQERRGSYCERHPRRCRERRYYDDYYWERRSYCDRYPWRCD